MDIGGTGNSTARLVGVMLTAAAFAAVFLAMLETSLEFKVWFLVLLGIAVGLTLRRELGPSGRPKR